MADDIKMITKTGGVMSFRFDHALALLQRQDILNENEWSIDDPNYTYIDGKLIKKSSPGADQGTKEPKRDIKSRQKKKPS